MRQDEGVTLCHAILKRNAPMKTRGQLRLEGALEEVSGGLVGGEPVFVQQEAVDLIGEDELLDGDVAGAKSVSEGGGLGVGDVGVIVAVDEKNGRAPVVDVCHGRAGMRESGGGIVLRGGRVSGIRHEAVGIAFERPLVDAVEVDAGGEEVGVASEGERGEEAAVTSAPDADAGGVDISAGGEIFLRGEDVVVFAGAVGAVVGGFAEVEAVTDASAIVDAEDDEAARGEVLVHGVGVGVVVHAGIAEKHLAVWAAMDEDDGGMFAGGEMRREEELGVDGERFGIRGYSPFLLR